MKKSKLFTVLVALILVMSITLVGCSSPSKEKDGNKDGEKLKVAVVLAGFLGDKSFNDSAWVGIERAKEEFNLEVKVMESKVPADWESNVIAMAQDGYDVVIGVSTQFEEIIEKHAPSFPNVKFALIDGVAKKDNVVSAIFAQNEGSFLAGAAAALFTQDTNIPNVNDKKIIGWVGGMEIPVLHDFLIGYKQGAKHIDPDTEILVSFAGTFNDPLKGKELTLAQYSQGADIVMNVASNTGNGILEAAKDSGFYAIGVDLDQDDIYPGSILTSMLKRVDIASYTIIKSVIDNTFKGGEILVMDVANGGISLTDMSVMKDALGDKFPQEILTKIQELTEEIKVGTIVVESYPGFSVD